MKRRTFIQSLVLSSGAIMVGTHHVLSSPNVENALKVRMIYNNYGNDENLINHWGLSMIIENDEESLLFDTGGNPVILQKNIDHLGIETDKISNIVISHNHLDHINGLPSILENKIIKPKVYIPDHDFTFFKEHLMEADMVRVAESIKISDFAWSTGEMSGMIQGNPIYEQSLIVKQDNFLYLFTGCSHPGIVKIVEKTRRIFPDDDIKLVAGGFHLIDHTEKQIYDISYKLKNLSVEKIAPSHCTGDIAIRIFQDEWENDFINFDLSSNEISI